MAQRIVGPLIFIRSLATRISFPEEKTLDGVVFDEPWGGFSAAKCTHVKNTNFLDFRGVLFQCQEVEN